MNTPTRPRSKTRGAQRHLLDEADIGSGEKTPGQEETEKIVRQIGGDKPQRDAHDQDGEHPDRDAHDDEDPDHGTDAPDPQAEQVGTAHHLTEQPFDELSDGGASVQQRRLSIEQDEPDSLLDDLDPVPPKGN